MKQIFINVMELVVCIIEEFAKSVRMFFFPTQEEIDRGKAAYRKHQEEIINQNKSAAEREAKEKREQGMLERVRKFETDILKLAEGTEWVILVKDEIDRIREYLGTYPCQWDEEQPIQDWVIASKKACAQWEIGKKQICVEWKNLEENLRSAKSLAEKNHAWATYETATPYIKRPPLEEMITRQEMAKKGMYKCKDCGQYTANRYDDWYAHEDYVVQKCVSLNLYSSIAYVCLDCLKMYGPIVSISHAPDGSEIRTTWDPAAEALKKAIAKQEDNESENT